MADAKHIIVTEKELWRLQEQLDYRATTLRKQYNEMIEVARAFGDMPNAEYLDAIEEQEKNEAEILRLQAHIAKCLVVTEGMTITEDDMRQLQERLSEQVSEYELCAQRVRNIHRRQPSPDNEASLAYNLEYRQTAKEEVQRLRRLISRVTVLPDGDAPTDATHNPP